MTREKATATLLILGIVGGVALRWAYPTADPPTHRQTGAYWSDETLAHDARARVVLGHAPDDAWQPRAYTPLYSLVAECSMRFFGPAYLGLRFPVMLFGTLLIGLAFLTSRVAGFSPIAALTSSFFVATSWSLTGFSKIAIVESQLLALASASLLFVLVGEARPTWRAACHAGAGAFAGCALLTKLSALGVVLPVVLYLFLFPRQEHFRERLRRAVPFGLGMSLVAGLGYAVTVFAYGAFFKQIVFDVYLVGRHKSNLAEFLYNAFTLFDSQALLTTPFLIACVALSIPGLLARERRDSNATDIRRFAIDLCLFTLVIGTAMHVFMDVPARRLLWVNLFMALLAAALWDTHSRDSVKDASPGKGLLPRLVQFALCVIAGLMIVGGAISPNGGLLAIVAPQWAAWLFFTIPTKVAYKIVLAFAGLTLGMVLYARWPTHGAASRRVLTSALVAQMVLYAFSAGLWFSRLSYTLRDTSVSLGSLLPEASHILGNNAVALQFENRLKPLMWYPGTIYGNRDEAIIQRDFQPHYMLLPDIMLARIRSGQLQYTPYVATFLENELERFPIYEIHESTDLGGDLVLFSDSSP